MHMFNCPLEQTAKSSPSKLFIQGDQSFTYQAFNNYVYQVSKSLDSFNNNQVIVVLVKDPLFTIALLIACLRKGLIFFPLSPRLPENEIHKRLKETSASLFFDQPIIYDVNGVQAIYEKNSYNLNLKGSYLLTSGSSNQPKICVHSIKNHYYSALGSNEHLPYNEDDSWYLTLPLFHVGGLGIIFRTLLAKASITLSSKKIEEALSIYPITHLSLVTTQLTRLIQKKIPLKSLKVILVGGGPIPPSLIASAIEKKLPIYKTYGLTEMGSQVLTTSQMGPLTLLPYREIKLDEESQICVKGETLFMGYLENGVLNRSLNKEGWFETRDLGTYNKNGFELTGRRDNQFISGGENIQPEEIEKVLVSHSNVIEAIVVPFYDPLYGNVPVAFIKTTTPLSLDLITEYLENYLPRFKIPKKILPLSYSSLKPSRKLLSEMLKVKLS